MYADTISSATISPYYPYIPQYNFTDSVIYKCLAAINDSTVIMDLAMPGMFSVNRSLIIHIRSDNSVWIEIYDDDTNGILTFGLSILFYILFANLPTFILISLITIILVFLVLKNV